MIKFLLVGKEHRVYLEGELITGPPELGDICLTRDGKQLIFEGNWQPFNITAGTRESLLQITVMPDAHTLIVEENPTHPDPDKNRIKEKLAVWNLEKA